MGPESEFAGFIPLICVDTFKGNIKIFAEIHQLFVHQRLPCISCGQCSESNGAVTVTLRSIFAGQILDPENGFFLEKFPVDGTGFKPFAVKKSQTHEVIGFVTVAA